MDNQSQLPQDTPSSSPKDNDKKILQPSPEFLSELESIPKTTQANTSQPPNPAPVAPVQKSDNPTQTHNQPPSINQIAKQHASINIDSHGNLENPAATLTFAKGYEIGSSIFWKVFLYGFVAGLVLTGVEYAAIKLGGLAAFFIIVLTALATILFIGIYVPYSVLKSNNVIWPFWLAIFGLSVEGAIFGLAYVVVFELLFKLIFHAGSASLFTHFAGVALPILYIVMIVGSFAVGYFSTKFAFGIAMMVFGKIKNRTAVMLLSIGALVAVIIGGSLFTLFLPHSATGSATGQGASPNYANIIYQNGEASTGKPKKSDPAPLTYISQTVSAHDFKVTLLFDPNSFATLDYRAPKTVGNETIQANDGVVIAGKQLKTNDLITIRVARLDNDTSTANINPSVCKSSTDFSTTNQGTILIFNATVMGQLSAVCQFSNSASAATMYINPNNSWYLVQFSTSKNLPISSTDTSSVIKTIANSLTID